MQKEKQIVLTYATHPSGHFQDLINNDFDYDVVVLGMNTKWNGFMDKIKGVLDYCKKMTDHDIIIFIDGFDTIMIDHPKRAFELFKQMDCNVLVSSDMKYDNNMVVNIVKQKFGTCSNDITANSGMYMGRVKHIRNMLTLMLQHSTTDDQEALNSICKQIPKLKIDDASIIFKNKFYNSKETETCVFVSYPGGTYMPFFKRLIRICKQIRTYYPYMKMHLLMIVLFIFVLFIWKMN